MPTDSKERLKPAFLLKKLFRIMYLPASIYKMTKILLHGWPVLNKIV